jgi:hypothetical protein
MTARRGLGILHLLASAGLLVTYVFQIVDLSIGGSFVADEYFLYFTNDTTMIAIIVLALTGVSMLRRPRDSVWLTAAALAVVPYALVTGIVYNLTLRGMPSEVYLGMPWANEVLHVAMPLFLALDWFVFRLADRGRPALPWRAILVALIFPVVWLAVTYIRGALTGWYPYPFLEPSAGPAVVGGYIGGIAVFVVLVAAFGILVSRARAVRSGSAGTT